MPPKNDPRLIRFLAMHALTGVTIAAALTYVIIKFDLFGIGSLIAASTSGPVAIVLLFAGLGLTFGSLAMGTAIFLLPKDEDRWR